MKKNGKNNRKFPTYILRFALITVMNGGVLQFLDVTIRTIISAYSYDTCKLKKAMCDRRAAFATNAQQLQNL
jgi:hypothetical protein